MKLKKLISYLLVTFMLLALSPSTNVFGATAPAKTKAPVNLVVNPGFEDPEDFTDTTDWRSWMPAGAPTIEVDTKVKHSGKQSLKLFGANAEDRVSVSQWIPNSGVKTYSVSGYVKTDNIKNKASVRLSQRTGGNDAAPAVYVLDKISGTNDWTQFAGKVTTGDNTESIVIELFLDASSGTVWYDDIEVKEVDPNAVVTPAQTPASSATPSTTTTPTPIPTPIPTPKATPVATPTSTPVTTGNTDANKLVVNGKLVDAGGVPPTIINGRMLVPLRAIFEALGAKVEWDDATKTATGTLGSTVVVVKIDNTEATVNGETKTLEVPAQIVNGRTLVPVRFIAESLGAKVDWDAATKTATVTLATSTTAATPTPGHEQQPSTPKPSDTTTDPNPQVSMLSITAVVASDQENDVNVPENTIDDNLDTRWSCEGDGQWIKFDLGSEKLVSYVKIAWYQGDKRAEKFDVLVSSDDSTWTNVFSGDSSGTTVELEKIDFKQPTKARYIKVIGHGNSSPSLWNSLTEMAIYGVK